MINYGTHTTIKFGYQDIKEYFDIANIEYYDAILGTPLLRKIGIILDFSGPGQLKLGTKLFPMARSPLMN